MKRSVMKNLFLYKFRESICIFALGSLLQPVTGAIIKNKDGEDLLDALDQWQCPDPLAKVIFKIEEESTLR